MGSAFGHEPLPPGVRPHEVVVASLADPGLVVHHHRADCPIEHPHAIEECGCFERGPRLGETVTVRNRPAIVTSLFVDGSYDVVDIPAGMTDVDYGRRFFYSRPTIGVVLSRDLVTDGRLVVAADGRLFEATPLVERRHSIPLLDRLTLGTLVVISPDGGVHSTFKDWRKPIGLVHVGMHGLVRYRLRVTVDGVDVSARCIAADDRYGWAAVYAEDEHGRKYASKTHPGVLAMEVLTGTVRIEER
ncbi:MAG: hypothetical protein AB7O67_16600 [Vicinamibacterales bacterium]